MIRFSFCKDYREAIRKLRLSLILVPDILDNIAGKSIEVVRLLPCTIVLHGFCLPIGWLSATSNAP